MDLHHHGMTIVLDDNWWVEAKMSGFRARSLSYRVDETASDRRIFQVAIKDIAPVRRAPGIPIFNDSHDSGSTARERVLSILCAFREDASLPAVEVVAAAKEDDHPFKLTHGAHRLYCSLAAGFTHVPAVFGFDINARYG